MSLAWIVLAASMVGGCEVGPDYHTPPQHMPAGWYAPPTTRASVTEQMPIEVERWWTTFHDPELDALVRRAVVSNLNVQLAEERIVQSRESLTIARSAFFPLINARGAYSRSFSNSGGTVIITGGGSTGSVTGSTGSSGGTRTVVKPHAHDLWQDGLDATWELDLFGGVRRSIEAADYTLQASIWDRRDVLVTLLGEVATDYLMLRGFQQEIVIADENLQSQRHNAEVTRKKVEGGTTTDLDVANADAQVASTLSQLASFISEEQQTVHALSVLLGREPRDLAAELQSPGKIPIAPPRVPVGLPSELLRRRPDIRRAERDLAAATANIGVATADLFPKFSLNGTVSMSGSRYQSISNWDTRFWSFGPSFSWPVFDAGRIWANIRVQNALQAQALTTYRQTVLTALQDVENALVAYSQEQQRRAALNDAVAANQKAVAIATRRYQQGLTDFLNVLVAQGSLYSSQDALVQSDRAVGTDLVALYKALGGGWEIGEPSTTRPARQ